MRLSRLLVTVLCLAFLVSSLLAEDRELIQAEFRAEVAPDPVAGKSPLSEDEVARALLEEARWALSGMIWGFRYTYVPYDATRGVEEAFSLEPIAQLPPGDPALRVLDTAFEDGTLRARVELELRGSRLGNLRAWRRADYDSAQGVGRASQGGGLGNRRTAVEKACIEALRAWLRPELRNKPKSISGVLAFAEAPRVTIASGDYVAVLRIRLKAFEIESYPVY